MSLSNPLVTFGTKTIAFYNVNTGLPYGISRYFDQINLDASGSTQNLTTGAYQSPVKAVTNERPGTVACTLTHFETWMFAPFFGQAATALSASTDPAVSSLVQIGTKTSKVKDLTVAILDASKDNAKFGRYIIRATEATKVNIYGLVDSDFDRGTDVDFQDESLKLLAEDLTISGSAAEATSLGLSITGSASPALTVGDSAIFTIYPALVEGFQAEVNSLRNCPEIGMIFSSEKASDQVITIYDFPRVVCMGGPLNIGRKDFLRPEFSFQALAQANGRFFNFYNVRLSS